MTRQGKVEIGPRRTIIGGISWRRVEYVGFDGIDLGDEGMSSSQSATLSSRWLGTSDFVPSRCQTCGWCEADGAGFTCKGASKGGECWVPVGAVDIWNEKDCE